MSDPSSRTLTEINPDNLAFAEELYYRYLADPSSVDEPWRSYFAALPPAPEPPQRFERSIFAGRNGFHPVSGDGHLAAARALAGVPEVEPAHDAALQERVNRLIQSYRERGHLHARLDPLGLRQIAAEPITLEGHGLAEGDLDRTFSTEGVAGPDRARLRDIVARLEETYCRSIGVELAHVHDAAARRWLENRMESTRNRLDVPRAQQRHILAKLTAAETFEQFLGAKFIGSKRFSLEGAESLIPLVDLVIERAGRHGVREVVIGMAHRGRLNVLANILAKPPREVFAEFRDLPTSLDRPAGGDVKYHLGYSADVATTSGQKVHLSLAFNPSHLEFVDTVVQGRVRAKQDRIGDGERAKGLPLVVHGDAAFAGQGIVAESLNMSELPGYSVGGTVHVVVNNQIGFTTSPEYARSGTYSTDIAKSLQIPIFHVNGEDPEAVAQVVELAVDFRQHFHRDVVVELWCYRKHGHNEADEPSFTQPVMYRAIARHPSIREAYVRHLVQAGALSGEQADELAKAARARLDAELEAADAIKQPPRPPSLTGAWSRFHGGPSVEVPDAPTAVPPETLHRVAEALTRLPEGFHPHPKIRKLLDERAKMGRGERAMDWGMGEALAFGTLAWQGVRVRLSGQDSRRGTFSHRHAALSDYEDGAVYLPLQHLKEGQAPVEVIDSPLSEASVLGFDYGYSLDMPEGLVVWEAQFGDFVNSAQVIIDQFIVSSEAKWNRISGLVMLLPHGMEGQGPEHSSARLERFLNQCVEDNIQVVNLTTPAQLFHALRRQVLRPWRKPLVVMSPKSLLRHPLAASTLGDLAQGRFQAILPDPANPEPKKVRRILLCTGKVYYDLAQARDQRKIGDVALLRLEQLYPLREDELLGHLARYENAGEVAWVQEEPRNQGAWSYVDVRLSPLLRGIYPLSCVSRPVAASPASGSSTRHKAEQERIINQALGEGPNGKKAAGR